MKNQLNLADFDFFRSNFQQQDPLYGYFSAVAGQVRDKSQSLKSLHWFWTWWTVDVMTIHASLNLCKVADSYLTVLCFHKPRQDGQISADELQRCLTQSGISGSYQRKSKGCLEFKKHLKHNTDFGHFILYLNYICTSC